MILQNKRLTLCIVVAIALLMHALTMLWIKDMKIDYTSSGRALMENQYAPSFDPEASLQRQEENNRRTEQIAEALHSIIQEKHDEQKLNYDTKHIQEETYAIALDQIETSIDSNSMPVEDVGIGTDNDLIESLASSKHTLGEERQSSKYLRKPAPVEILFPQDEYFADDLIMATEMALGNMSPDIAEEVQIENAVRAGKPEEASLKGTSLQNRSGMLDQGLAENSAGTGGSFSLSSEFGIWNYHAFSQKNPMNSRDALLPRLNKDELRGFDYNSLGAIASSDDFQLSVEYAPRKDKNGYLFKLELTPKKGVKFRRIKQNISFLVDRSHSIRLSRYEITKTAVSKALALLHQGDTFNVLVFDDAILKLSPENLSWSPGNVYNAREFIKTQKYGGIFASTDLYSSLGLIVPQAVGEDEINTAILLSDGDTFLSSEKQRASIGKWTSKNAGKVSLFTVASGKGNHLPLLDLLSVLNKGTLNYSATDRGLENTLFSLMQNIRNPIGKDITITTTAESDIKIQILPLNPYLPNLYENTPYIIYGAIDKLIDFHVFFQGRYYDKQLDIKQKVSFASAAKVDTANLEAKWALQEAYVSYSMFLNDGQQTHMDNVKRLLMPLRIPLAFK